MALRRAGSSDKMISDYKTPCYIVHEEKLRRNLSDFNNAFLSTWGSNFIMGYSIKTNHLPWILQYANQQGLYMEAVSDDEFDLAMLCGIDPSQIIFNGPQKGKCTIKQALSGGSVINLDNFADIQIISECIKGNAKEILPPFPAQIGLRVNFDLEKYCPGETTAGESVSRFGFCLENGELESAIKELRQLGITVCGFHMHYSTVSRSGTVFKHLAEKACEVAQLCEADKVQYIDIGGGFWGGRSLLQYPSPIQYAEQISTELRKQFDPNRVKLIIEPGASILASAIDYRCRVANVRTIRNTHIVTLDGTTLHINPLQVKRTPAYFISHTSESNQDLASKQIICGCTCMENDRFFECDNERLLSVGDEIIFPYAGAYTMGFNSCFIQVPPAVYLSKQKNNRSETVCIRKRASSMMFDC